MTIADSSEEVLHFDNNSHDWLSTMKSDKDVTFNLANTSDTNDAFLQRPIKIATLQWEVGLDLDVSMDPWTLFFTNSKVINRIAHFKNLRATLHVKFLINGSPFHYGRLMASYNPLPKTDVYSVIRPSVNQDWIAASQRPKIFIDPTMSQGGQIECPFIWYKNTLDIPTGEWNQMGNITLFTLNPLQHANGSTEPVTVTVFAWCSEFDISTPTSLLPASIVPQAGDEYGMVSGPAHTIANWSGKLSNAPVIGKFARATSMVSGAVGAVAQLFGFSRPRDVAPQTHKIVTGEHLAETNVVDHSQSLALDAKKEITIDPTVTGAAGIDEMALVPLACKESYVTRFGWNVTDLTDTHLFSIRVRPTQGDVNGAEIHMTPSSWCALPFEYWTGSMEFRLQVISSAYHRGRLRIVWDPDYYDDSVFMNYNTNYQRIVDISHMKDIKFKIGWGQNRTYLPVSGEIGFGSSFSLFPSFSVGNRYTDVDPYANGTLSVYVANGLTAPNESGDEIQVNVFANACDDFELAGPTDMYLKEYDLVKGTNTVPPTDPNPSPPRNPGGNPPPTEGPLEAPPPASPTEPVPPIDAQSAENLVKKAVNPFPIVTGEYDIPASTIGTPEYSDLIGVASDRAMLLKNNLVPNNLNFYTRAAETAITETFDFVFQSATSGASDVTVILNGESPVTATFPAGIGEQVTVSVTTTIPASNFDHRNLDLSILTDDAGRILLQSVETMLYSYEDVIRVSPSSIVANQPPNTWSVVGDSAETTFGSYEMRAPSSVLGGADIPGCLISKTDIQVGFVNYNNDSRGDTNACPIPFNWSKDGVGRAVIRLGQHNGADISVFDLYTLSGLMPESYHPENLPVTPVMNMESDTEGLEDGKDHEEVNAPEVETVTEFMGPPCVCGPSNQVFFGEQVSSWRQLVKRYTQYLFLEGNTNNSLTSTLPIYPTETTNYSDANLSVAFSKTIFSWFVPAYVCMRGGYRYKYVNAVSFAPDNPPRRIICAMAGRIPNTKTTVTTFTNTVHTPVTFTGGTYAFSEVSGSFGFEVPWYSNDRFEPARGGDSTENTSSIERQFFISSIQRPGNTRSALLCAASEDFSVSHFLSVPVFTT